METSLDQLHSPDKRAARAPNNRLIRIFDAGIFCGLIAVMMLTAIPYGTVEPWSHAAFAFAIFLFGLFWVIHGLLTGSWHAGDLSLFYPLTALVLLAILQSLSWSNVNVSGLKVQNAISSDPFESWVFAIRLAALTLAGVLAVRFTRTLVRVSALVHAVILLAVLSAIFGIMRQAMQHDQGFLLPFLRPGGGFAQFINRNHFAFLVEAAMGLLIGMALLRPDRRERLLVYFSAILLLWVALVMSRSRGGLLAVTVQTICAALLLIYSKRATRGDGMVRFGLKRIVLATVIVVALLGMTVAGVMWLGGDQLTTGVETATAEMGAADSAHESARRRDFWLATWKMARAHPIAGAGLGGFWAEIPRYHDGSGAQTPHQAHNDYLELLASGGIIGAAIFIWFVVVLTKKGRRAAHELSGLQRGAALGSILGLVGIAVHSLVDFGLHITINGLVFVMLLSILSLNPIDQRPDTQAHRSRAFN